MKNKFKLFVAMHSIAIIALISIIGFSFIACDEKTDDNETTVDTALFAGTWNKAPLQLIISGNNFTIKNNSVDTYKGTLTCTGTETAGTMSINVTHINHSGNWQGVEIAFTDSGTYTAASNTFTISGLTVDGIALANGIWTKQGSGHSHSYSDTWSKDATQHWKECSCGDKTQIANHSGNPCVCGYTSGGNPNPNVNWTAVTNSTFNSSDDIRSVVWGNNKFVAVGDNGKIAYSSNGVNWTAVADSKFGDSDIYAVAWGNNKFVAVGGGFPAKIAYSSDGINWTAVADNTFGNSSIYSIAWGNNKFVAGDYDGKMAYSSDGINWTAVADSTFGTSRIRSIAWGNNKFIATGNDNKVSYSSDGINWTAVNVGAFNNYGTWVAWGKEMFVAVGMTMRVMYSMDGINWTITENALDSNSFISIAYGDGMFVTGGYDGKIAYSTDGITWTAVADSTFGNITDNYVRGIAWGNDKFVAVASQGRMAYSGSN